VLNSKTPLLVAIVGGSGAGKSWLAERLQQRLGGKAARLSLDDFYRDRSYLSPRRRDKLNFDHPRSIDWEGAERTLSQLRSGRSVHLPSYDFVTHCRLPQTKVLAPKPVILVDGLWLLRKASLRRLFDLRIFLDCPAQVRMQRRLARDIEARALSRALNQQIFRTLVEPMHRRYVAPQIQWANVVLRATWGNTEIEHVLKLLAERRFCSGSSRRA
jgi:uridine kinase